MPDNVTAIRKDEAVRIIDVREEQKALLEAEDACLTMLETCSKANIGFVSYIRKLRYSIGHPKTRQLLDRSARGMEHVFGLFSVLTEAHGIAKGMALAVGDADVVMSGGITKGEKGAEQYGPDLAEVMR